MNEVGLLFPVLDQECLSVDIGEKLGSYKVIQKQIQLAKSISAGRSPKTENLFSDRTKTRLCVRANLENAPQL